MTAHFGPGPGGGGGGGGGGVGADALIQEEYHSFVALQTKPGVQQGVGSITDWPLPLHC